MEVVSVNCEVGAGVLRWNSCMVSTRAIWRTDWHWKRLSLSFSGLCCQYYFTSEPLVFPLMPLCQQDTPVKPGNLQTKQCSIFTTYFRRLSRRLSAHTNVTLPFSLKTYHQACEHNLYLLIVFTLCSHAWCLYGRTKTKTTVHICTYWYAKL